jgi:hypothetical protein
MILMDQTANAISQLTDSDNAIEQHYEDLAKMVTAAAATGYRQSGKPLDRPAIPHQEEPQ